MVNAILGKHPSLSYFFPDTKERIRTTAPKPTIIQLTMPIEGEKSLIRIPPTNKMIPSARIVPPLYKFLII